MVKLDAIYDIINNISPAKVSGNLTLFSVLLQCSEDNLGVKDSGTFDNHFSHKAQLYKLVASNNINEKPGGRLFTIQFAAIFNGRLIRCAGIISSHYSCTVEIIRF